MPRRSTLALILSLCSALVLTALAPVASAAPGSADAKAAPSPEKLDVLFVGAHPDDEAFSIPTFGQWSEYYGIRTGVVTVTRGEGGGNAVGPEEGPALGLLREAEERRAVGHGNTDDIFYLDDVDFYYTVSAPLTAELWGHDASLERIVRIIRETRPEVILTMNPSPAPGNHGNHQYAARLAVEAYHAAADPGMFPDQITREHLQPWSVKKIFTGGLGVVGLDAVVQSVTEGSGVTPPPTTAEDCQRAGGTDPTDTVYNVWNGRFSEQNGMPWAAVGVQAANEYASQGFSGPIAVVLGALFFGFCNQFIQIDSRVPSTTPGRGAGAIFEGATYPAAGGLPTGTLFYLTKDRFNVVAGTPFTVTAHAKGGTADVLGPATVSLALPSGWTAQGSGALGTLDGRRERTTSFVVTPPADAPLGRVRIPATLSVGALSGQTIGVVQVAPSVSATLAPLPHVAEFRAWAAQVAPQLDNLIKDRQAIGVGESRSLQVNVSNITGQPQDATVSLALPAGFSVDPASRDVQGVPPGGTVPIQFQVTNTDPSLATSDDGGNAGDYDFTITTATAQGTSAVTAALNLVPVTTVPHAAVAPTVDGVETPGEYTGPALDVSRQWEGLYSPLPLDASGTAKVTFTDDALYLLVNVVDQAQGFVMPPSDCKRHWRTDSVEITIDPRNNSENTSTTFKTGIFPSTDDPANGNPPCFERDADNHQGPGPDTAPGMEVASVVTAPYHGYTIETKIPFADLPAAVDPADMGLNILIYDSDTRDKTGQHRLAWSPWGGVQGDPYRWGHAVLPGYTPPPGQPIVAPPPIVPDTAAASVASPQSIEQSVRNHVTLAGQAATVGSDTAQLLSATLSGNVLTVRMRATGPGAAHAFAWTGDAALAQSDLTFAHAGRRTVSWTLDDAGRDAMANGGVVLLGFAAASGATAARSITVGGG